MVAFKSIVVPVDFGDPSKHALEVAVELAKQYAASLTLIHTWEVPVYAYTGMDLPPIDLLTPIESAAREQLEELLAATKKDFPQAKAVLRRGVPWREILATVEEQKADLVIMGTHGRRGIGRALLGSVAEKVVRMSPAAVLTVHGKAESR